MLPRNRISFALIVVTGFLFVLGMTAQAPLPELRVQATDGGSVLHLKNVHSQPLTAFLIELVDYPGSSFSLWQDDAAGEALAPGAERAIPITNMTVGAAPEYVKMRAAVYEDGTTAGIPEKAKQLVERRHFTMLSMRKLVSRLENARLAQKSNGAVIAELNESAESLPKPTRRDRNSQETINNTALRGLLTEVVGIIGKQSLDDAIEVLTVRHRALARSLPSPNGLIH